MPTVIFFIIIITVGKNSFLVWTHGTLAEYFIIKADVLLLCCLHSLVLTFPALYSKQLLFPANFLLCCMHFIWRLASCSIQPKPALARLLWISWLLFSKADLHHFFFFEKKKNQLTEEPGGSKNRWCLLRTI